MRFIIYALVDPTTSDVRYIGQTRMESAEKRLGGHVSEAVCFSGGRHLYNSPKASWIRSLVDAGTMPKVVALQIVECCAWAANEAEQLWLSMFVRAGANILNGRLKVGRTRRGWKTAGGMIQLEPCERCAARMA